MICGSSGTCSRTKDPCLLCIQVHPLSRLQSLLSLIPQCWIAPFYVLMVFLGADIQAYPSTHRAGSYKEIQTKKWRKSVLSHCFLYSVDARHAFIKIDVASCTKKAKHTYIPSVYVIICVQKDVIH